MMKTAKKCDDYFNQVHPFQEGLLQLRSLLLEFPMKETLKWKIPVYTWNEKNIVGLGVTKHYFALWFFQGVFLKDPHHCLVNAQEGKTKGMRHFRFKQSEEIDPSIVRDYIAEAIQNQKEGKVITINKTATPIHYPEELQTAFNQSDTLKNAFQKLTPGKQKEFANHIAAAKQAATRKRRLVKSLPLILNGIGLNDKYKNNGDTKN